MQDLNITIIQTKLIWEDIKANLSVFDNKIDGIREKTDLIVLPEMFTTGFSMNAAKLAQEMNGISVDWLKNKSCRMQVDIAGSMIIKEDGKYFNRLLWAKPDGTLHCYDKKHLFRMTGEEKVYSEGKNKLTVELNGWKIRPFVCYDLRFPCWTRNFSKSYDVAVFVANWPEARSYHWETLLLARAIENQCYVIGVNRVGKDGNGYNHIGQSSVVDPTGNIMFRKQNEECIHTAKLSYSVLQEYRNSFPAWMDADSKE
ncbi:MAG: amidohydrolase [Pseudomonadota bacterium]